MTRKIQVSLSLQELIELASKDGLFARRFPELLGKTCKWNFLNGEGIAVVVLTEK